PLQHQSVDTDGVGGDGHDLTPVAPPGGVVAGGDDENVAGLGGVDGAVDPQVVAGWAADGEGGPGDSHRRGDGSERRWQVTKASSGFMEGGGTEGEGIGNEPGVEAHRITVWSAGRGSGGVGGRRGVA